MWPAFFFYSSITTILGDSNSYLFIYCFCGILIHSLSYTYVQFSQMVNNCPSHSETARIQEKKNILMKHFRLARNKCLIVDKLYQNKKNQFYKQYLQITTFCFKRARTLFTASWELVPSWFLSLFFFDSEVNYHKLQLL